MNICIVATSGISLSNFRGSLIRRWVADGHRVTCISIEPEAEMSGQISKLGASYRQVTGSRTGIGIMEGLKMIMNYYRVFKEIKPDNIFLYMSKPVALGGPAAIWAKIPHINILVNGLENAYYRTGLKDRLVRKIMSTTYRFVGSKADNVFMQNSDDYQFFIEDGINSGANLSIVNGSGVDMTYFKKMPLPEGAVFLMTARLLWSKGIREYLRAIEIVRSKCPDARFILVGGLDHNDEAITKSELEDVIARYGIEYCGYTSDVRPYISSSSIFVLPSYHEGTPRSVLEAMSMGRAIITTTAPGCKETVIEGVNGFLVPVGNHILLADRMVQLAKNPSLRVKMGEESHRICSEKFEINIVNDFLCKKMDV